MADDWTREYLEKHIVSRMTAETIPVNMSFRGKQKILDMGEMERLLRKARVIAQQECDCRKKLGNCIEPMDGCLCLDNEAEEMIEKYLARRITVEQALEALGRTSDAGFVHMAYTFEGQEDVGIICSCCTCCCHSLSAALRFGYQDHVMESKLIAVQDDGKCTDCGKCAARCHFGSREMMDGKMVFRRDRCFGCGLCVITCPGEAISMEKRENSMKKGMRNRKNRKGIGRTE